MRDEVKHVETWPRLIKNTELYEEIPQDLRSVYEADVGKGFKSGIYLIYCPPAERLHVQLSEKLFYVLDSSLIYVERGRYEPIRKEFKVKYIQVLEIGFVLLDSWMTVAGRVEDRDEMITVYFNHVVGSMFEKLVEMLRFLALGIDSLKYDNSVSLSLQKNNEQEESYRFSNYTRNIAFNDEGPAEYVFQRVLTGKYFAMLRVAITNAHILMSTGSELIQITEGKTTMDRYGHTNTFYIKKHLNKPAYSKIENSENIRLSLSSGIYNRDVLFDKDNTANLAELISQV